MYFLWRYTFWFIHKTLLFIRTRNQAHPPHLFHLFFQFYQVPISQFPAIYQLPKDSNPFYSTLRSMQKVWRAFFSDLIYTNTNLSAFHPFVHLYNSIPDVSYPRRESQSSLNNKIRSHPLAPQAPSSPLQLWGKACWLIWWDKAIKIFFALIFFPTSGGKNGRDKLYKESEKSPSHLNQRFFFEGWTRKKLHFTIIGAKSHAKWRAYRVMVERNLAHCRT